MHAVVSVLVHSLLTSAPVIAISTSRGPSGPASPGPGDAGPVLDARAKAASDSERARLSVTKALKSAVKRIAVHDPVLGLHLEHSIRTGAYCSYAPDPASRIVWG